MAVIPWCQLAEEIRQTGFKNIEGRHRCKDGSTIPVEVNIRQVKIDREYHIASVRDITRRKQAEAAIQNQLHELERWHEVMIGREDRVLELKREVNELLGLLNRPLRYEASP